MRIFLIEIDRWIADSFNVRLRVLAPTSEDRKETV